MVLGPVHSGVGAAASPPASTVIPIRLSGNYALVDVRIGGRDIPLLFDTGDSRGILLAQPVIDRIKAKAVGQSSKVIDVKGNIIHAPRFEIPRLQIGSIEFTNVVADLDVHDPSYQPDQHGQQGFLGTGLLKPYQVVIDYSRLTVTLIPPGNSRARPADCRGVAVPFHEPWGGEPVTEVETGLGRVVLWWDTGTPLSILSTRFAQQARPKLTEGPMLSDRLGLAGTEFG
ncbi:MAG TPA: aspartyl protease family protein, partial [Steroidobacteraceae bacterium]|nr:aspartyl protease family protein [Steroidobacteraceae bacterium]